MNDNDIRNDNENKGTPPQKDGASANAPCAEYSRKRRSPLGSTEKATAAESERHREPGREHCAHRDPTPLMLVNEISKLFGNYMRENTADPGLNNSSRQLLFHLAHRDGRTQLELARLTHLTPPTVSISLTKLESDGYIRREADPADLRQTLVYLTDKGLDVDRRARAAIDKIDAQVTNGLSAEQTRELCSLLTKLRDSLIGESGRTHEAF